MAKFNTKDLIIAVFLGMLLVGIIGIVNAQQALPTGGNSLETAAEIKAGSYRGGSIESKGAEYFYVVVKAREEIDVKATFTAANIETGAEGVLSLYSEDKARIVEKIEGFYEKPVSVTASWLAGTTKDSYKCYIKVASNIFKIDSYLLDISLKKAPTKEEKGITPDAEKGAPSAPPGISPTKAPAEGKGITPGVEGAPEVEKGGPNWTLILGIIAIIVVVGIVAYLLLKRKKGINNLTS